MIYALNINTDCADFTFILRTTSLVFAIRVVLLVLKLMQARAFWF